MDNEVDRKLTSLYQTNLSDILNNFTLEGQEEKTIYETIEFTKQEVLSPDLFKSHHKAIKKINKLVSESSTYKRNIFKNNYSFESIIDHDKSLLHLGIESKITHTLIHPVILFSNIGHPSNMNPLRNIRIKRMKKFIISEILRGNLFLKTEHGFNIIKNTKSDVKSIKWYNLKFSINSFENTNGFIENSGAKLTLHEVREKFFGRQTITFTQLEKRDPQMKHLTYLTAEEEMAMLNSYIEHSLIFDYLTPDDIRLKRLKSKSSHWSAVLTREELDQNSFIKYEHLIDRFYRAKQIFNLTESILQKSINFNYHYFSSEYSWLENKAL